MKLPDNFLSFEVIVQFILHILYSVPLFLMWMSNDK